MSDNLGVSTGADATVRTKDNAGVHLNVSAIADTTGVEIAPVTAADGLLVNLGANNDVTVTGTVSVTEPVSVDDNAGSLTGDNSTLSVVGGGVEATALRVTVASDSTGLLSVDDNGGSLTVDNSVLSVVGGGTEATAQRVTIANDSTGVLSIDDNGGSITVDGTVTATNPSVIVDDAGFTITTDSVTVIGGYADDNSTDSVNEGDAGALRMTLDRKLLTRVVGATDTNRDR